MSDEAEWYYTRNGREIGPLDLNELRNQLWKIVDWGHIYVWHPRMIDEWMPARAITWNEIVKPASCDCQRPS